MDMASKLFTFTLSAEAANSAGGSHHSHPSRPQLWRTGRALGCRLACTDVSKTKQEEGDRTSRETQAGIGHSAAAHRGGHVQNMMKAMAREPRRRRRCNVALLPRTSRGPGPVGRGGIRQCMAWQAHPCGCARPMPVCAPWPRACYVGGQRARELKVSADAHGAA